MYKIKATILIFLMLNVIPAFSMRRACSAMPRLMTYALPSKALVKSPLFTNRSVLMRVSHTPKITATRLQSKSLFKPSVFKNQNNDKGQKFNWHTTRSRACLAGTGAALAALYVGSSTAKSDGQEKPKLELYKNPYEAQRKKYYEKLLAKPWGEVSKKYIDALEAEEKELMKELSFELRNLSEEEWSLKKKFYEQEISKLQDVDAIRTYNHKLSSQEVSVSLLSLINECFKEVGIDPQSMKILMVQNMTGIMGISSDGTLYINEVYNKVNDAIKSTIFHEAMHLLHSDALIGARTINYDNELKWSVFCERRADILSALISLNNVEARKLKYKPFMVVKYEDGSVHNYFFGGDKYHPPVSVTYGILTQLHEEMLEAIEKNKQKTA
jgi:hypothetical protein